MNKSVARKATQRRSTPPPLQHGAPAHSRASLRQTQSTAAAPKTVQSGTSRRKAKNPAAVITEDTGQPIIKDKRRNENTLSDTRLAKRAKVAAADDVFDFARLPKSLSLKLTVRQRRRERRKLQSYSRHKPRKACSLAYGQMVHQPFVWSMPGFLAGGSSRKDGRCRSTFGRRTHGTTSTRQP